MTRKPLGKRLRFSIFARDSFTCRYCGRQADAVAMEVDHVIPVCKGGTDDESNLVTACVDCNGGKAGIPIVQTAPTETDRLRLAQEMHEQREAAENARLTAEMRSQRRRNLEAYWMERTGRDYFEPTTLATVFKYVQELGEAVVYDWIERAAAKGYTDTRMGRYISGIRRSEMEGRF